MTSIYEITGWSDVGSFLVWTLAVCAIAKALFGSLPAAELQYPEFCEQIPRRLVDEFIAKPIGQERLIRIAAGVLLKRELPRHWMLTEKLSWSCSWFLDLMQRRD
jgi:hypothetical protein